MLIEKGAIVNAVDEDKYSALLYAALDGNSFNKIPNHNFLGCDFLSRYIFLKSVQFQ